MLDEVARLLETLYSDLLVQPDTIPEARELLAVPLCKTVKLLVPNVHQKIDEIIIGHEKQLHVHAHQHGADATDTRLQVPVEIKVSVMNTGRCNFNWCVPSTREKLLASVREKVGDNGYAIFRVVSTVGVTIAEYTLQGAFLLEYFTRLPLKANTRNHNFGAQQCTKCLKFHRLELMQKISDSRSSVSVLFTRVASQCS
jgi:hypothetical protein